MVNSNSTNNLFCVVYRMGGTDNFTWHRTVAMPKDQAVDVCALTKRGGRAAMVVNYALSMAIGLPETYEAK